MLSRARRQRLRGAPQPVWSTCTGPPWDDNGRYEVPLPRKDSALADAGQVHLDPVEKYFTTSAMFLDCYNNEANCTPSTGTSILKLFIFQQVQK